MKILLKVVEKHFKRNPPRRTTQTDFNDWIRTSFTDPEKEYLADLVYAHGSVEVYQQIYAELARLLYLSTTGGGDSFSMSRSAPASRASGFN